MTRSAILAPEARAELLEAVKWIARDDETAARALRTAVGAAARLIGQRPEIGHVRPELAPPRYRFWSLTTFPYVLVYEVRARPPRIARIVHMARDLAPLLADLTDPPSESAG